jgi:hypothetical protein
MANVGGLAGGAAQGLQAGQQFGQNQQMNPYLLQHQQLQNQLLQQRLAGGQAGTGFQDSIGGQGIADIGDYMKSQGGQGGADVGSDFAKNQGQGAAGGQGQAPNSAWNNLVDPLGIIQQLGLPLPQDPTTFLNQLGLPGLAFGGQGQQGGGGAYLPSRQGQSYGTPSANYMQGFQPSATNYWGIGGL